MTDRQRLTAFETRLHHTALVTQPALVTVFVRDVHLDTGDVLADLAQRRCDNAAEVRGASFVTRDVMVGIDLNLNGALLSKVRGNDVQPFYLSVCDSARSNSQ